MNAALCTLATGEGRMTPLDGELYHPKCFMICWWKSFQSRPNSFCTCQSLAPPTPATFTRTPSAKRQHAGKETKLLASETCSPAGTAAAEKNGAFRNTCSCKNGKYQPTHLFLLSLSAEIAHFKSGSYLESRQAGERIAFLFHCAESLQWFEIITRLRREEQPPWAAMLTRTCSHGGRDTAEHLKAEMHSCR